MNRLLIMSIIIASLTGCSVNSSLIPKKEEISFPEKYLVKKEIIKNPLSDEEKQNRIKNWWGQFENEELLKIIESAQKNSPTISAAALNIKAYENTLLSAKSKFTPDLSLVSSSSADYYESKISSNISIGLKTSWELDILGRKELITELNKKKIENAKANWHEAQTIVAAEAARSYFSYQFCKKSLSILKEDYEARKKQNEITHLKVQAGFEAQTSFYQNEAGLSQSQSNIIAQEAQCETEIKSLVALSAIPEEDIRLLLSKEMKNINKLDLYVPVSIPAELLNQRPDVLNAVNNLQIAALEISKIQLDYYPSVSFSGNIYSSITNSFGMNSIDNSLSIGPISVHLPLFDMGVRKANEELLLKNYEQSKIELSNSIRNSIKEIEIALINLSSRNQRSILINRSVENYKKAYEATTDTYKVGLSSLFDLEDTRRNYLNELSGQLNNESEKINAWINLYKAVGGGFRKVENNNE